MIFNSIFIGATLRELWWRKEIPFFLPSGLVTPLNHLQQCAQHKIRCFRMFWHQTTLHSEFQPDLELAKNITPIFRTVYQKTPLKSLSTKFLSSDWRIAMSGTVEVTIIPWSKYVTVSRGGLYCTLYILWYVGICK